MADEGRGFAREMFDVTCSDCGQPTQVPFRPTEGKPVYCRECYAKRGGGGERRGGGGGGFGRPRGGGFGGPREPREMTEVTCDDCGKTSQVPFKPTPGKPVYCQECFAKRRPPRY